MTADWLTDDIITAVVRHMNDDHADDTLLIVREHGVPDAVSASTVGLDLHGMRFAASTESGVTRDVVVPFSAPLTGRADIRAEVVRMHTAAGGRPPGHPSDH